MIRITGGKSIAELHMEGAYLSNLVLGGTEILKKSPDGEPTHGGSAVLIPYAGRVRNAEYTYKGKAYTLPRNNGENSIHGFLKDQVWELESENSNSATFQCNFKNSGYPGEIETQLRYSLQDTKLSVRTMVKNVGETPVPLLIGFHPYFSASGSWSIKHAEKLRKLNFMDQYFPDGTFSDVEFNSMENMSSMELDNCFLGGGRIELSSESHSIAIERTGMPYLVIYNGKYADGRSVAIEPMTGAPDSFNNGMGLIELEGGSNYECAFSVEKLP